MVEAKSQLHKELYAVLLKAIEAEFKAKAENFTFQVEDLEELKIKVKPRLLTATKELENVVKLLRNFQNKHGAGGKSVLNKTLQFYLNALKFDPQIIMAALDNEIEVIQTELEKISQLR